MAEIFRKTALDRISSRENLDKAIVIISPSFWIAMLGVAGIIVMVFVWSIFGRIHENISADGIFMNREGVHSVYSEMNGIVEKIAVDTGDYVRKGEVIAFLSTGEKVFSTLEGTVTELAVVEGQMIAAGDYIARVAMGDLNDNVVVCYVPVNDGRKIKVGMKAFIYPSTVNKQEYGHMKGTVVYVDNYVTSRAEIINQVGVISLADAFLEEGPVVEVRLELEKDAATSNGYWWSNSKGAAIDMVNGTMVSADIAVMEKRPIELVLQTGY
ncbi:MAG: HlyD family efflux transporter periplasmic adaptor subunit [Butyrivibrio sp.]|uniref:HlyD family efflux transporter periplasmic adaptor subunit n=1 Tax=Butyrivibrio sp. TaxID=28121 RepID=UPI001B0B9D14|nr:HlyD family efflux transporter periplasmic adaptor subunit [Butyrivibrio sp.]MBO6242670.1 HlyD family efflux transporter periplasmic adaptor subunit [Butyrivibrio sp.]